MTIFVSVLLAILAFAAVVYPFFKRRAPSLEPEADDRLRELASQRDTTYSMLKELEFDFQSGVLTEADYRDLEARYKKKAIPILKGMDDLKKATPMEDEIEEQVRALRSSKARFCPKCGAGTQEDDSFCSHCGAPLKREG